MISTRAIKMARKFLFAKTRRSAPRRTTAAFSDDDTAALLFGIWVRCDSSNVLEAHYNIDDSVLTLGFDPDVPGHGRSGVPAYYHYDNISWEMAQSFARAPSKGGWVWDALRFTNWPFRHAVRT